ncbi:MAG: IS66 family insertion sequence element accessory protein TnpA [Planctomycetota bacterium]
MAGSLDSPKVHEWRRRMARFQGWRRSVAEFCRREGVSDASFYQWRRRLAGTPARKKRDAAGPGKKAAGPGRGQPVGAEDGRAAGGTGGFAPVRLVTAASVGVHLPGGTQLCVPISDPEVLRLVMDALVRADAERVGGGPC